MISHKIFELLKEREFINVATCDLTGRPNVAPKLVLKLEDSSIYLIDYVIGMTFNNLKINPRVSLGFMDLESLIGYQINGTVEIIDSGPVYKKMLEELSKKEIELSVQRIIEGVDTGKSHEKFEIGLPDQVILLKIKIEEFVEINSSGKLIREVRKS